MSSGASLARSRKQPHPASKTGNGQNEEKAETHASNLLEDILTKVPDDDKKVGRIFRSNLFLRLLC